jgi:hypothetical protein
MLALLALAACASTGKIGPSAWEDRLAAWQAANPGRRFTLVDGTYKGEAALLSATGPDCPAPRPGIIVIGDGRLMYPYDPATPLIAPIGADGAMRAQAGNATLEGRIGEGSLAFTVRTPSCETAYRLRWYM